MKRLFAFLLLVALARAESLYVTQAGAGSGNGSSLANAFSASAFNTSGNWGVGAGKISAGDTVFLSGAFTTRLTANGSGTGTTDATRITLKGDGSALVGINLQANDYFAIIGCTFTQTTSNAYPCIGYDSTSTNVLVYNCYFNTTYQSGIAGNSSGALGTNWIIRRNRFNDISGAGGGSQEGACVYILGDYKLIEYNTVTLSLDRFHTQGQYTIVRNNAAGYTDTTLYPNTSQYPYHTDFFQTFATGVQPVPIHLMIECNWAQDNTDSVGGGNAHWTNMQDNSNTGTFNHAIMRFNLDIREGGGQGDWQDYDNVYPYNNTFYDVNKGLSSANTSMFWDVAGGTSVGADVRNTTWDASPNANYPQGLVSSDNRPASFTSGTNHADSASGGSTKLPASASPANLATASAQFTDTATDDYTLQSGSPLRATGSRVTTANGSGTGSSSLTVNDAYPISDGWTLVTGDQIKIGSNSYVGVTAVNYSTKVVTLDTAITWSNGDTVLVQGNEDVGALPYGSSKAPAISSGAVTSLSGTATVTVANTVSVRFVEVLVDGIPVGTQATPSGSTYTVTWTGDGSASHTFTAVAYSRWGTATPTVEQTITFAGVPIMSGNAKLSGNARIN